MRCRSRHFSYPFLAAAVLTLSMGCSGGGEKKSPYVGNMSDYSYAGIRGHSCGTNVAGNEVSVTDFEGRFVWVDYAAPWCGPCAPQARVIGGLEKSMGKDVVFLTVLTSDHEPFSTPTRGTAKMWSSQYGLNPNRVLADGRRSSMTIPQHFLFSPSGQTLFHHTGLIPAQQIKTTVLEHKNTWAREDDALTSGL